MTVITHQKEGIAGLPAPTLRQEPLFSGFWMLKMQKPGLITGLWCLFWCATLWPNVQIAHSKKALPIGKAFYLVAERTGLEPATPGVTGRYSNRLNYRSAFG